MERRLLGCLSHRGASGLVQRLGRGHVLRLQCRGLQSRSKDTHVTANNQFLDISEEVREAVYSKKPVVALETTIYTHGWAYPENLTLAKELEDIVRSNGAVPATIGILKGVARVGMTEAQMLELMDPTSGASKISRRDLSFAVSQRLTGGTTIASTTMLARLAGIAVFATGGLGGVHRGAESSMDVSADLTELGRSADPVAVIASGCKGFLDIPRTLEYLETQGAVVATFADGRPQPVDFPAFWVRDSGIKSPLTIQDEKAAAALLYAQIRLNVRSGILLANPVPEEASIGMVEMEDMISHALRLADAAGIHGSANTPFVLKQLKELSRGQSVIANRSLVERNVKTGAQVAVELSRLLREEQPQSSYQASAEVLVDTTKSPCSTENHVDPDIIVAGSVAVDTHAAPFTSPQPFTSNPASITQTIGGVGYNVALAASFTNSPSLLFSALANDVPGSLAVETLKSHGLSSAGILNLKASDAFSTAQYIAFNGDDSNLHMAMADMAIFEAAGQDVLTLALPHIAALGLKSRADGRARWLVVDANWSSPVIHSFLAAAKDAGLSTAFEPVSTPKGVRLFDFSVQGLASQKTLLPPDTSNSSPRPVLVDLITPNTLELSALHAAASKAELFQRQDWWRCIDALGIPSSGLNTILKRATSPEIVDAGIPQQAIQLLPFVPTVLTKLGADGVLLIKLLPIGDELLESEEQGQHVVARTKTGANGVGGLYVRLFPPAQVLAAGQVVNVNGAGDSFLGALISGLVQSNGKHRVEELIDFAQKASVLTIKSAESVSPALKTLAL